MTTRMGIVDRLLEDLDAASARATDCLERLVELRLRLERDLKKMAADRTIPNDVRKVFVGVQNGTLHPSALEDLVQRFAAQVSELEAEMAQDSAEGRRGGSKRSGYTG